MKSQKNNIKYSQEFLNLNIYGITSMLHSNDMRFLNFIKGNYSFFLANQVESANLKIFFSEEHGHLAKGKKERLYRYGEDLYLGENALYWENKFGFSIFVDFINKKCWEIYGYHFDLNAQQDVEEIYKNYMRSMRWMIHYPIFMLLKSYQGKQLLHATALSKNKEAIIFTGLNKVGKSSLGWYLFNNHGYQYLSDNFLLADGKYVYAFPEKARLSKESLTMLDQKKYPNQAIYEKHHLSFQKENIELQAKPLHVFIVNNHAKLMIEPIKKKHALLLIDSLHEYLKEFPEHSFYGLLNAFELSDNNKSPIFPDTTRFYKLSMPLDWSVQETANEVLRCISTT